VARVTDLDSIFFELLSQCQSCGKGWCWETMNLTFTNLDCIGFGSFGRF